MKVITITWASIGMPKSKSTGFFPWMPNGGSVPDILSWMCGNWRWELWQLANYCMFALHFTECCVLWRKLWKESCDIRSSHIPMYALFKVGPHLEVLSVFRIDNQGFHLGLGIRLIDRLWTELCPAASLIISLVLLLSHAISLKLKVF